MAKKRRKKQIDETSDKLKKHLHEGGYEVVDATAFFNGIDELYRKPTVEQVVQEELPTILNIDQDIFIRNQIDISNTSNLLSRLYHGKDLENASWQFKVGFRHIRFFLRDAPEEKEQLEYTIKNLKIILNGMLVNEEILVQLYSKQGVSYDSYIKFRKELGEKYNAN
ncbi:MAG TPA: hypothetical protein VJJ21_02965 [Candidatus Nanoarchaeia archaeon]|nr:hypothetical protein [Candidatus Nanoarchaeia archaeon]